MTKFLYPGSSQPFLTVQGPENPTVVCVIGLADSINGEDEMDCATVMN